MIIFGTRNKLTTVGSGSFYCPHCQAQRNYEKKQGKRYFALYFVPLIPMGDLGMFVECMTCHMTFDEAVLNAKAPAKPVSAVELLNSVKSRLLDGDPVEYVVRDLTAAGIERDIALSLIDSTIGTGRRYCKACNLSYANTIDRCQECQRAPTEGI